MMMQHAPVYPVVSSPTLPCYPEQQHYFGAPPPHFQYPHPAHYTTYPVAPALLHPNAYHHADPNSAPYPHYPPPSLLMNNGSAFSSVQSSPALESAEWSHSPFEGYTSSVPALFVEEQPAALSTAKKQHADVTGRRQRIAMACTYCRRRKIRCDGAEVCASCARSGRVCDYAPVPADEGKPVRVRRVPLANDDSRRKMTPSASPSTPPYHRQHVAHPYAITGYPIQGYSSPATPTEPTPGTYGGYGGIPAWSSAVMGAPPTHAQQPPAHYPNGFPAYPVAQQLPMTPAGKPFPSVLVSTADHTSPASSELSNPSSYETPSKPSSSYHGHAAIGFTHGSSASGSSISGGADACACGGHSSGDHSSSSSSSISPPHTPVRQTVSHFASQPIVDLTASPFYKSYPATFSHPSSAPSTSAPSRPALVSNQYYLPYTPAFSTGHPDEVNKPQLVYPQTQLAAGTATSHAGLVGLGITMPQGSVGLFDAAAERLTYAQ